MILAFQLRLFDDVLLDVDTASARRAQLRQRRIHMMEPVDPTSLDPPGRAFWVGADGRVLPHSSEQNTLVCLIAAAKSFDEISHRLNLSLARVEKMVLKLGDDLGFPRGKGRRELISRRYWMVREEMVREELERLNNPVFRARRSLGS